MPAVVKQLLAGARDLVKECQSQLATAGAFEARAMAENASAESALETQVRKARGELHERLTAATVKVVTNREAREAEAREQYTRQSREAAHAAASAQQQVHQKLQEATWLADSVLDSMIGHIKQLQKKAMKSEEENRAGLQSLEAQAAGQLSLYGMTSLLARGGAGEGGAKTGGGAALMGGGGGGGGEDVPELTVAIQRTEAALVELRGLGIPNLMVGLRPWGLALGLVIVGGALGQAVTMSTTPSGLAIGIGCGVGLVVAAGLAIAARVVALRRVEASFKQLTDSSRVAMKAITRQREVEIAALQATLRDAQGQRDESVNKAVAETQPLTDGAKSTLGRRMSAAQQELNGRLAEIESVFQQETARHEAETVDAGAQLQQRIEQQSSRLRADSDQRLAAGRNLGDEKIAELTTRARTQLEGLADQLGSMTSVDPASPAPVVEIGAVAVGPALKAEVVAAEQLPPVVRGAIQQIQGLVVPVRLDLGRGQGSVIVEGQQSDRVAAADVVTSVVLGWLRTLPPGKVRFTLVDPVGLGQTFAPLMHLADFDADLVGMRVWTDPEQIDRKLGELTEHMETVIQKYLRNVFADIAHYNLEAGALAEPYRVLVVNDFPVGFSPESLKKVASIAASGARCGVYVLLMRDVRKPLAADVRQDLYRHSNVFRLIEGQNGTGGKRELLWPDAELAELKLAIDAPPPAETLTAELQKIGKAAKEASRIEIPFSAIAPSEVWAGSTANNVEIAVGRCGVTRLQQLKLGSGVAQHVLVAGKTGSGKSTLLHTVITSGAMKYSPQELEFYLIDFKKGVEFKPYATHRLAHARAIAMESDREFGLSVLQRLDEELVRRGDLFRGVGVQDVAGYRLAAPGKPMPRTLLVVDEYQELFSEDDRLSQEAALLLDRLIRQGRAFGVHVILGTQTVASAGGLPRATLGQIGVRIALQSNETDSQLILGENNLAARLLGRPGEAIYNDAGGLVEGNSPFQVAMLRDSDREAALESLERLNTEAMRKPIVFEGGELPLMTSSPSIGGWLADKTGGKVAEAAAVISLALGQAVRIGPPTSVPLRAQAGGNALVVGQNEGVVLGLLTSMAVSAALQKPGAEIIVLDGTPEDAAGFGLLGSALAAIGAKHTVLKARDADGAVVELVKELAGKSVEEAARPAEKLLIIASLHRFRSLRKSEDSFGFGGGDEAEAMKPDKALVTLLKDGPVAGMHVIAGIDSVASLERTFDRSLLRELDHRVLLQMSATDSSHLIDSPAANRLGPFRAIYYSEERGVTEKFLPYEVPVIPPLLAWLGRK